MENCLDHCDLRGETTERGESGRLETELGPKNGSSGKGLFLWLFIDAFLVLRIGKPSFDTCRWQGEEGREEHMEWVSSKTPAATGE